MADTFTPNYSLTLVEVGASRDTWGTKTNNNMTSLDSTIKGQSTRNDNQDSSISSLQTQVTDNLNSANSTYTTIRNEYKAWVPIGTILMWCQQTLGTIPAGWAICDGRVVNRTDGGGSIGTPNLVGYFIKATAGASVISGSGNSVTDAQGSHSHGGATAGHVLTTAEMPSHTHGYSSPNTTTKVTANASGITVPNTPYNSLQTDPAGGNAAHSHGITADGTHQHNVSVDPPSFSLIFIMRY
jgi:microcystin-dependent protein